jgi:hypothetical protein
MASVPPVRNDLAALLFVIASCGGTDKPMTTPPQHQQPAAVRHWRVYDGDVAILEIIDEPGILTSTAPPPPDGYRATHPFLTGHALSAAHEDRLRTLLLAANSTDEFVRALEQAGFRVVAE